MSFFDFLVDKEVVRKKDVPMLKSEMDSGHITLDDVLVKHGVSNQKLLELKSEFYNIPSRSITDQAVPFDVLKYVPEESALHYKFVPIGVREGFLEVGIVDPDSIDARDALNFISAKTNMPFKIFLITEEDFSQVLQIYKGLSGEVTKALGELENELGGDIDVDKEESAVPGDKKNASSSVPTIIEDAPVTKIVATILRYAVEGNASDVHVEHLRERIRVRFRVDGVLNTSLVLPSKVHSAVIARIKILSNMKLDEKRKPQDGRFSARIEGRKVDFRVSTFPAYYGEKVVMRILDQEKGVKKIDELGMTARNLQLIKSALDRPYGLILISGPTGSGKSTTLYSILGEIDTEQDNVLSLEDPVEYSIEGVSQSQVRAEIGYTFAQGLRTTLRQDPDVIMVGEIRDKETAQLAIQAALTGHLVFSTIHTNTAAGIVPRLIDMGVDPYLIPPTLVLGIAQRLVRLNGPGAGRPEKIEGSIKAMIENQFKDLPDQFKKDINLDGEVLFLQPTPDCPNGTRGREAVFEVFEMDHDVEKIILTNPVESEIYNVVRQKGMLTMKEDAILKALQKKIPFEEVNKL